MPTPIAPGCIEVVIQAEQSGTERFNVLHCHVPTLSVSPSDITAAATAIQTAVLAHLSIWSDSVKFLNIRAQDKSMPGGIIVDVPFPGGTTGTNGGTALPGNVAAVATLRTATGGRSGHGRVYMFGLVTQQVDPGDQVKGTYVTAVLAWFTDIQANLAFVSQTLAVFSRVHAVCHDLVTVTMDLNLDSQRRRLPGRGR
jgi:hypothetical protein